MNELFYPDVSSNQGGMSIAGAAALCCKVSQGRNYANPFYQGMRREAAAMKLLFFGYHFLEEGNAAEQARWCFEAGAGIPLMLDCEPEPQIGSRPTLADLIEFVDEYRKLGAPLNLAYLPRWYWQELGSPSLEPLKARGMKLVSSDYLPYSDVGPGWEPYGGVDVAIWQYTETALWNGRLVDRNAFKGTVAQLGQLITTGSTAAPAAPRPAADEEDDDMRMLNDGPGAESIISFERGSTTWIALACDASRTRSPAPVLRVAVHSATRGMSQVETVTMPLSGKHTVNFTAKDADFLSIVRAAANDGDNVAVGYNLG